LKQDPKICQFLAIREKTEDGKELHFDHGAPFFSVGKSEVLRLVEEWESRGLVAEWKEKFGFFDFHTREFNNIEQVDNYNSYAQIVLCSISSVMPEKQEIRHQKS